MQVAIKCKNWNESERREKNNELCETVGMLQDRAVEKYGEPSVRRLRSDFINGLHTFGKDQVGRAAMEKLIHLEDEFLSAYVRQICKIAHSYWEVNQSKHPTLEADDYLQEACVALTNSVYHYDGIAAFSNYLHNAVNRCLSAFLRENESVGGIGRRIKKLRKMVVRAMDQDYLDIQQAIEHVRKTEEISQLESEKLVDSVYVTTSLSEKLPIENPKHEDDGLDRELVNLCIEEANLTPMERELVDAYMVGNFSFRSHIAETRINPSTGDLYTKQTLGLYFKNACAKIKKALVQRDFAAQ